MSALEANSTLCTGPEYNFELGAIGTVASTWTNPTNSVNSGGVQQTNINECPYPGLGLNQFYIAGGANGGREKDSNWYGPLDVPVPGVQAW